jgi:hypothetical protein
VRAQARGVRDDPQALGERVARQLRELGAGEMLARIVDA